MVCLVVLHQILWCCLHLVARAMSYPAGLDPWQEDTKCSLDVRFYVSTKREGAKQGFCWENQSLKASQSIYHFKWLCRDVRSSRKKHWGRAAFHTNNILQRMRRIWSEEVKWSEKRWTDWKKCIQISTPLQSTLKNQINQMDCQTQNREGGTLQRPQDRQLPSVPRQTELPTLGGSDGVPWFRHQVSSRRGHWGRDRESFVCFVVLLLPIQPCAAFTPPFL